MRTRGHSLIELLVCIAIIGVIASMYLPALVKARRKAEEVAIKEGLRQNYIGRMADSANSARVSTSVYTREACRDAFRFTMQTAKGEIIVTRLLYVVKNEDEFRAYWHTFINPSAAGPAPSDYMTDEDGNRYPLVPVESYVRRGGPALPEGWEFISTHLGETSSGTASTNVAYTDGHIEFVRYPNRYPACAVVAELSHRFVEETS
ncbi:MAG: prepilin-type N-terminal cleavage/methylation domain-containing protein [Nitrospiraceae bacterium]|nr:prepilin-type N-terminal cleavage/methylation domain-containing protein [Nitrospiraceae bacterium]